MSLTNGQRRAAEAPGDVAVTAGAGTGKTHTLGHRYLWHLERGLSPLQIAAVTFTDRAAGELRARVRRYLAGHPDPPGGARATAELEAAQISTLHAMAARICRDHPDAAGVAPDFSVLGELEGRAWFADELEAALADLPADLLAQVPFPAAAEAMQRFLEDPVTARRALARARQGWGDALAAARASALTALRAEPAWAAAADGLRGVSGADGDVLEAQRRAAEAALADVEAGRAAEGLEALAALNARGGRKEAWAPGARDALRDHLRTLRARARDALAAGVVTLEPNDADRRLFDALPALEAAFEAAWKRLDTAKRRARVLGFADLEAHALQALERPEVRADYATRWRAVLVDEFQDTNPVQEALVRHLAEGATLTVVGDAKQGIYGFRGADAAVFDRTRARIREGGGESVVLDRSFRTHAPLLARLNTVSRPLLGELHQDLSAERAEAPHGAPHVEWAVVEAERGVSKARRQVVEARWIARRLRALVEGGTRVEVETGPRPLRYGDVAVLARSWAALDVHADLLPALGVPAVHTGGGDLLATREASDALVLLRVLADPGDDLAWAALLRSPYFAVDDRTLLRARETAGGGDWATILLEGGAPDGLQRPREVMEALLSWRERAAPSRLLAEADRMTGYEAVLAHLPGAARRRADARGFASLVRELETGHEDVFTVVRRLRRIQRSGVEAPRPRVDAGDAVTLTTVHRAKGLEWPVVVVADLGARRSRSAPLVRVDPELGVAFEPRGGDPGETERPALATLLAASAEDAEAAEAARVAYVALTRARDRLLLTATEADSGLEARLAPGLEAAGVAREAIPFDEAEARWPEVASPTGAPPDDDPGLWRAKRLADGETGDDDPNWAAAAAHLEAGEPGWLPLLAELRAAGAPPPDRFDLAVADGAGGVAPLAWSAPPLALVARSGRDLAFDAEVVSVDPDDPVAALGPVLRVLGVAGGADP